jgi:Dolichyl-phosphate-mannose-protein mannosyltransferase
LSNRHSRRRSATKWQLLIWPAVAILMTLPSFQRPILFFEDDAMFYPQIAFNLVRNGESTFHGITPTNGYHPLWMIFNIAAMWLAGDRREPALYVITATVALLCAALALLYRILTIRLKIEDSLIGTAFLLLVFCTGLYGMEAHLWAVMTVVWCISFMSAYERDRSSDWIIFGICSGLVVLSRLDAVFLVVFGIPIATLRPNFRDWIVRQLAAVTPLVLMVAPYLAFNQSEYGHMMPISGAIKGNFPHFGFAPSHLGPSGAWSLLAAVVALAVSVGGMIPEAGSKRLIRSIALGVIGQAIYIVTFTKADSTVAFWYYVVGYINIALLIDFVVAAQISRSLSAATLVARGALAAAVVVVACGFGRALMRAQGINLNPFNLHAITHTTEAGGLRWQEIVARWMDQNLPADARVLVWDQPGYLGYRTRAAIISCDGLVNDYNYNTEVVNDGIANYLAWHHINYYFGPSAAPGSVIAARCVTVSGRQNSEDVQVFAALTGESAGSFQICRDDRMMQLDALLGRGKDLSRLSLFKIEPANGKCDDHTYTAR